MKKIAVCGVIILCTMYVIIFLIVNLTLVRNFTKENHYISVGETYVTEITDIDSKKLLKILLPLHVIPCFNSTKEHPIVYVRIHDVLIGFFEDSDRICINNLYYEIGKEKVNMIWNEVIKNYGGKGNDE